MWICKSSRTFNPVGLFADTFYCSSSSLQKLERKKKNAYYNSVVVVWKPCDRVIFGSVVQILLPTAI